VERGKEPTTPEASEQSAEVSNRVGWLGAALLAVVVGLLMAGGAVLMGLSPLNVWLIGGLCGLGAVPYILAIGAKQ